MKKCCEYFLALCLLDFDFANVVLQVREMGTFAIIPASSMCGCHVASMIADTRMLMNRYPSLKGSEMKLSITLRYLKSPVEAKSSSLVTWLLVVNLYFVDVEGID